MSKNLLLLSLAAALFLSGCSFRPSLPELNESFKGAKSEIELNQKWWQEFKNEELNALVERALENNANLKSAFLNLQKASLSLSNAKADWLPNINLNAGASKTGADDSVQAQNSFSLRASLNYELDLWGRVRDNVNAQKASLKASEYDYEAARLSIAASVAKSYFELASLKAQKDVLKQSVASYEKGLLFYSQRLNLGAISQAEYLRALSALQNAQLNLASVESALSRASVAMAILVGASNDEILAGISVHKLASYTPDLDLNLPASLLSRRPDIAAAKQRVIAQNALIGVARTAWLPQISLSAGFGYASTALADLLKTGSWSLGANLAQNIFSGGKTQNATDLAKLNQDSAVLAYELSVKKALGEVKNGLDSLASANEVAQKSGELMQASKKLLDISDISYKNGAIDQLALLDAQRALLNAELAYAKAQNNVNIALTELMAALGGGFKSDENKD